MITTPHPARCLRSALCEAPARERLEIHNIEIDRAVAARHLCGNLHLPTGRVCLLPERHRGGCEFASRPSR
jgi:hypothetical protein